MVCGFLFDQDRLRYVGGRRPGAGGGHYRILVTPFASSLAISRQPATEIPQTAFETHHDVGVDGWLPVRVTALRLGAGRIRLCDAQRCVQQLVGVG
jgi:hypothetical protein